LTSTSTTQTFQATTQGRPVVTDGGETGVLTNSCQAPAVVQRIPHILPRPPVVPGQSLKPLVDRGQQKSLVNGQVTGSPKTIVVTNGQSYPKSPHIQGTKGSEMTVKPIVANTSSCVVTPVSSRVSTAVSSNST